MADFLRDHYEEVEITPQLDLRLSAEVAVAGNAWMTINRVVRHPLSRDVDSFYGGITDADVLTSLGHLFLRGGQELRRLQKNEDYGLDRDGNPRQPDGPRNAMEVLLPSPQPFRDEVQPPVSLSGHPDAARITAFGPSEPPLGVLALHSPEESALFSAWGPDPDSELDVPSCVPGAGCRKMAAWFTAEFGWTRWHVVVDGALGQEASLCGCFFPHHYRSVNARVKSLTLVSQRGVCKNCLRKLTQTGGY